MRSIPLLRRCGEDASRTEKGARRSHAAFLLIAMAVVGTATVWWATDPYPGVTVDSAEYLAVAQGVLSGEGFTMPYLGYDEPYRVPSPGDRVAMTQFPPLYPSLLALLDDALPGGSLDAARLLGGISMGAMVAAGCWVVRRETGQLWPALIAGGLLLAPDIVTLHAMAWSEPPMILALIGCLYFTSRYVGSGRGRHLFLAFGLGAVASLARFAGIAFIAAIALTTLFGRSYGWARQAVIAVLGAALALVPVGLWFARNLSLLGEVSEKEISWHPPGVKQIAQAVEAVGAWVVPGPVLPLAGGVTLIVLTTLYVVRRQRFPIGTATPMARTCSFFFVLYAIFVVATRTLLDQNVSMDLRILSPLHMIAVIAISCRLTVPRRTDLRKPAVATLLVLSIVSVSRGLFVAGRFSDISVAAYTGDAWRDSETLAAASRFDKDLPIATNAPDPLWLWQDRLPLLVPPRSNRYSGEPNGDYLLQVGDLKERLGCDGLVVWFDQPTRKPPRIIDPVLAAGLGLERVEDLADGEIYAIRRC